MINNNIKTIAVRKWLLDVMSVKKKMRLIKINKIIWKRIKEIGNPYICFCFIY